MEEQGSIDGETEILIEEDVRGTGEDPDIGETERGLEEDIGEGDLIEVKRLLFTHRIELSHITHHSVFVLSYSQPNRTIMEGGGLEI